MLLPRCLPCHTESIRLNLIKIPSALIKNLVGAIYWFSGESVQSGEDSVSRFTGEVSSAHHTAIVLPDRFIQEHSRPFPRSKLSLSYELDPARLHSVNKDSLTDDE